MGVVVHLLFVEHYADDDYVEGFILFGRKTGQPHGVGGGGEKLGVEETVGFAYVDVSMDNVG